jgi:hypothetical protein
MSGRPRVLALTSRDICTSSQVSSIFSRFVVFFTQPLRSHLPDFLVEFMVFASDPQIKWLENPILHPHPLARIPQSVCDDRLNDNGTHLSPGKQAACRYNLLNQSLILLSYSNNCKKRKIKCSGEAPCRQCAKQVDLNCVYERKITQDGTLLDLHNPLNSVN